ncbi:unnamed protein product [Linum trigynum]|uniref:Uncharacterized protein n=1 Tax=Linum trigynum TaxID=586398 RepID=A0AAV2F839_9ROSI
MMVRVGMFCYPTNFASLDISEDSDMPLILDRSFLATAKALIDVNKRTLILRDGKERIKLEIDPKVRSDEVTEVVSNDVNESGGEPLKANPTIPCAAFGNVVQEMKEGTMPKEKRKNAWRKKMKEALVRRKEKAKEKLAYQEGQLMEPKTGYYKPRPESVVDPLSEAS